MKIPGDQPPPIDFDEINRAALACWPQLLQNVLPGGRLEGNEYVVRNPTRADNQPGSFKINARGTKAGVWCDFATGDKGNDPVSLCAYVWRVRPGEAATRLAEMLNITAGGYIRPQSPAIGSQPSTKPVTPIPENAPPKPTEHPILGKPTKTWIYRNGAGQALSEVWRFDRPGGKEFRPLSLFDSPEGLKWEWKYLPEPRPSYGLDRLAACPVAIVVICEGEKSCDAAERIFPDCVSVTSSGGANAADKTDWSPINGREVLIWPDNDEVGAAYAATVAAKLLTNCCTVRIIDAATLASVAPNGGEREPKKGWDAADAFEEWDLDALRRAIVENAKPFVATESLGGKAKAGDGPIPLFPPIPLAGLFPIKALGWILSHAATAISRKVQVPLAMAARPVLATASLSAQAHAIGGPANRKGLITLNGRQLIETEFPPRLYQLVPWLPEKGLAMVFAARGIGKTWFAMNVAVAVAAGSEFLKFSAPKPRRVVYIDGEMPARALHERFVQIVNQGAGDIEDDNYFRLIAADLQPDGLPDLADPAAQRFYDNEIRDAELIVVDNISTLCRAHKENEADGWGPVQEWGLRQRAAGKSVVFVHHAGKGGTQRGTSRKEDVLDTVIKLQRPPNYDASEGARFELHFTKSRGFFGQDSEPFEAKLVNGVWIVSGIIKAIDDQALRQLRDDGLSVRQIADRTGLSKSHVQRHLTAGGENGSA